MSRVKKKERGNGKLGKERQKAEEMEFATWATHPFFRDAHGDCFKRIYVRRTSLLCSKPRNGTHPGKTTNFLLFLRVLLAHVCYSFGIPRGGDKKGIVNAVQRTRVYKAKAAFSNGGEGRREKNIRAVRAGLREDEHEFTQLRRAISDFTGGTN